MRLLLTSLFIAILVCMAVITPLKAEESTSLVSEEQVFRTDKSHNATAATNATVKASVGNPTVMTQRAGSFGKIVDAKLCNSSCSGNGECHQVFTALNDSHTSTKDHDTKYICFCHEKYIGESCNDCRKNFFGKKCEECPRNPADEAICGKYGICDDGLEGTGECLCKDADLEPSLFCESASHEAILEEEENFTMLFFIVLCVIFLSLLVLYLYSKVPGLENFPE